MKRTVDLIEDSSGTLSTSTGVEIAKAGDSFTKAESYNKFGVIGNSAQMTCIVSIPNDVYTKVDFDTNIFDDMNLMDSVGKVTIPSGVTRIALTVGGDFSNIDNSTRRLKVYKNGVYESTGLYYDVATANYKYLTISTGPIPCSTGDYFEVYCKQDSGGTATLIGSYKVTVLKGV